ncbi:MAG TPA: THUMP domain-containing protein [Melioribacteraceae bacterium]|nr:THUMP domain-containing protein [Melioribacteraceae bacterium]
MYIYQKNNRYFASVADDIKDLAELELTKLGATSVKPGYKGIFFTADKKCLYNINLYTRLLNRILAPLFEFETLNEDMLYKKAYKCEWEKLFKNSETFAIFASAQNSNINHSKFASLKLKDAIVDRFRDITGKRPNVDPKNPDIWFNLHIENNKATISLDTSGGSLHRRGYRKNAVEAPMAETLAASILMLSEWDLKTPLYDPMCGSGTLLCEAYLLATNTPPGILRRNFGIERLPDFDKNLWSDVNKTAKNNIGKINPDLISGSDVNAEAVKIAKENINIIDKTNNISIKQVNLFDIEELKDKVLVFNPPYGIRLKTGKDLSEFYKQIGDFLKQKCTGSSAFIYFGEREYLKKIGLKAKWKHPLQNGGLDGRLAKFEMY